MGWAGEKRRGEESGGEEEQAGYKDKGKRRDIP